MVVFSCLDPVDLARILKLLKLDMSALMGATSAVFQNFFGNQWGKGVIRGIMLAWAVMPLWWSVRKFNRRTYET
jgi:Cu-processing system permease protein